MVVVGMLSWWYSEGWKWRFTMSRERLSSLIDYFSIGLLLCTLFAPYRQISAGHVNGPLVLQWRAFVDRTISRIIGAIVRSIIVIVGVISVVILAVIDFIVVVAWGIIPLLPIAMIIFLLIGWIPPLW